MRRGPRALRPVENRPIALRARLRWPTWRGCLRNHCGARSIRHRVPRRLLTDIAPGRRLRLRNVVTEATEFRGSRFARASPSGEPTYRPRSMRALADLAWSSSGQRGARYHPTPFAETCHHRHRARSAAAASKRRNRRFWVPWRAVRARFAQRRTGLSPMEHARAGGLGVVVFSANAERAASHAVGRGSNSTQPRLVGGCGFEPS